MIEKTKKDPNYQHMAVAVPAVTSKITASAFDSIKAAVPVPIVQTTGIRKSNPANNVKSNWKWLR